MIDIRKEYKEKRDREEECFKKMQFHYNALNTYLFNQKSVFKDIPSPYTYMNLQSGNFQHAIIKHEWKLNKPHVDKNTPEYSYLDDRYFIDVSLYLDRVHISSFVREDCFDINKGRKVCNPDTVDKYEQKTLYFHTINQDLCNRIYEWLQPALLEFELVVNGEKKKYSN